MNLLINIHKDSDDVVVFNVDKNIARMTMTKEELVELIKNI